MKPIRVMIADDHLVFRMGLRSLLAAEDDLEIVGEARNGLECVEVYGALLPDVLLMDLRMPGASGLEALAAIRASHRNARVLFLTSYCTEEDVYQALQMGAMGYVLKDIERHDLMAAIRTVAETASAFQRRWRHGWRSGWPAPRLPGERWTFCGWW